MSKRIRPFFAPIAAAIVLAGGVLINDLSGTFAQRPTVVRSAARNAAIVATTEGVLKETSEIRELAILRPVKSGAQSRPEIERMLVKKLDEQMTAEKMHATEVSLRKFGLVPEGFEYRSFIIKLLTEQVAGYYDAKAREFYLADWLELEGQKPVMAHELTHALQDQHFKLRRFEKWSEGDSDAELAAHALIEGDATLAMTLYMAKNPMVALAFTRSLTGMSASSKQFNEAPRALRESLIFPYFQGMEWATDLYKRGGWKMVSAAYTKLPLSTEHILHPEKYSAYEMPVKVSLPDLENLLNENIKQQTANSEQQTAGDSPSGDSKPKAISDNRPQPRSRVNRGRSVARGSSTKNPGPGTQHPAPTSQPLLGKWERVEQDVNGEWSYYLILDEFLKSPAESKRAAAGWAGDRYAVFERRGSNEVLVAHVSVWDTANDAEEFFAAYVKRTAVRYPNAQLLSDGETATLDTLRSWQTPEGRVVIELRGSRVVVLEGIPAGLEQDRLLREIAGDKSE